MLQIKPGTDIPLLNSIMNNYKKDLYDKKFIEEHREFALKQTVEKYTPEYASHSGVPVELSMLQPGSMPKPIRLEYSIPWDHRTHFEPIRYEYRQTGYVDRHIGRKAQVSTLRVEQCPGACDMGASNVTRLPEGHRWCL